MSKELILILGGARGGKSTYAEELARELGGDDVVFVATAQALDEEMKSRIAKHQAARPPAWRTLEAPSLVPPSLDDALRDARVVVLDCLTLLTSNALLATGGFAEASGLSDQARDAEAEARVEAEVSALLEAYARGSATWIVVSNEVGIGVGAGQRSGTRPTGMLWDGPTSGWLRRPIGCCSSSPDYPCDSNRRGA